MIKKMDDALVSNVTDQGLMTDRKGSKRQVHEGSDA